MICYGHNLHDNHTLKDYGINTDATITINLRLKGGSAGASSKSTGSFKQAVKGKEQVKTIASVELPGPYIVEQKYENPTLTIAMLEVKNLYTDLYSTSVICRFNGFWPKSDILHQWIYVVWSPECEIYLCPKVFYIVRFRIEQEREYILNKGPWSWGNVGLFMSPWFLDFYANTMVVLKMPV